MGEVARCVRTTGGGGVEKEHKESCIGGTWLTIIKPNKVEQRGGVGGSNPRVGEGTLQRLKKKGEVPNCEKGGALSKRYMRY